ncbi:unnamed protein product [Cryptosporidium hominis]|uniref:Uncharacterized protein n=1 Tax=Cryptosporidium hominis TaxID=237895 RepID=A0A0S4TL17_CRYHO|nr:hypothetical protein [Cryptosporidium hominis TU502]OLQ19420.1 hypothetical protein ChTU502y2012_400fg0030 [Cryptosporidium hominis]PPA63397.1 hypothetical protein ChUKH1_07645 [Cryptosporidium hominis]PPS97967.1 Uncharacterized protein GY17_00000990 [Cryptosporidium hominis]CUV08089.1 unnamed protein product [Cryptosporidium hominis]|eukprot:PPS97967.1 Uncharacterized protein GY17_00000990 [Cryptosporidium hominis]
MLLNMNSSSKSFCFTFLVLFYLRIYLYLYEEKIVSRTYAISLVKLQTSPDIDGIDRNGAVSNPEQKHDEGDRAGNGGAIGVVDGPHGPVKHRCPGAPGFVILSVEDIDKNKNKKEKGRRKRRLRKRHESSERDGKKNSSGRKLDTDSGNDADCESTE